MSRFRKIDDENGVTRSTNSLDESVYEPSQADMRETGSHFIYGPHGLMEKPPTTTLSERVKDQVFRHIGAPNAMTFPSEMKSRAERLKKDKE